MSKDMIADFITIIRNGILRSSKFVVVPYSKIRTSILEILLNGGYIRNFDLIEKDGFRYIKIFLKYFEKESVIHEIKRISKPSRRIYKKYLEIEPVIDGLGISILTTNKGFMTDKLAKKLKVGGEVICSVW